MNARITQSTTQKTKYEFPNSHFADDAAIELYQKLAAWRFDTNIENIDSSHSHQRYTVSFPEDAGGLSGQSAMTFEYNGLGEPPYVECDFGTSRYKTFFEKLAAGVMTRHSGVELRQLAVE